VARHTGIRIDANILKPMTIHDLDREEMHVKGAEESSKYEIKSGRST